MLTVGGLEFRVVQSALEGRVSRPVFVIVHGIGSSHRYGTRLQDELALAGESLSLDLPGFGGTATPGHPLTIEAYATLLGRVFDALHLVDAVLIGHSMGAQIVVELALQRPDLVSHLVLVGPVVNPERDTLRQQTLDLAEDSLREPFSVKRIAFADTVRAGIRWFLRETRPMLAYPMLERLARLRLPVLVVRGADDRLAPSDWCADLAGSVPGGRLVEVRGQRHVVHLTAARVVAAWVIAFAAPGPSSTPVRPAADSASRAAEGDPAAGGSAPGGVAACPGNAADADGEQA
ncbi:alpha/beta fold hydrolase [Subtercola boreus]|uniref:alpha/beta fold hydrolase n=1 Tax=Subtercola boreus TaxID=120213 RepID=UPI00147527BD|nr:alpha/beta fold hydrolase [Subtercola boreus]